MSNYMLDNADEIERLSVQVRVMEPEVEIMLDAIGVEAGWNCVDLACGPMGILQPLARRVGAQGSVTGVDLTPGLLEAAGVMATDAGFANIKTHLGDAFATGLPDASFDLVHARFLITPLGRADDLMAEALRLAKPGGVIVLQEAVTEPFSCHPPEPAWDRLREAVQQGFVAAGGNLDAGLITDDLLRHNALEDMGSRAFVCPNRGGAPYACNLLVLADALRGQILDGGFMDEASLDADMAIGRRIAADEDYLFLSVTVTQVWGRKP